jgi:hypothetical protein
MALSCSVECKMIVKNACESLVFGDKPHGAIRRPEPRRCIVGAEPRRGSVTANPEWGAETYERSHHAAGT